MTNSAHRVNIEFRNQAENVAFARAAVAVFASRLNFTLDELDEIKVAVSEAVSNAVVHGYDGGSGPVRLILDIDQGTLIVTVEDDGIGIPDIHWAMQATHTTDPDERMGLGLIFIHEYMNEVKIHSEPGQGTSIRMVKRPTGANGLSPGDHSQGTSVRH